jgi:hypothetical protein
MRHSSMLSSSLDSRIADHMQRISLLERSIGQRQLQGARRLGRRRYRWREKYQIQKTTTWTRHRPPTIRLGRTPTILNRGSIAPAFARPALGWRYVPAPTWSAWRSDVMSDFDRCFNLPDGKGAENHPGAFRDAVSGLGATTIHLTIPIKKERSNS